MEGEPVTDSLSSSGFLAADLGHGPVRPNEIGLVDPVPGLLVMDRCPHGHRDVFVGSPGAKQGRQPCKFMLDDGSGGIWMGCGRGLKFNSHHASRTPSF